MAKLYFRYGAMGSSKTASALMTEFNYRERGQRALLVKSEKDTRDGEKIIASRCGLAAPCILLKDLVQMPDEEIKKYDCIIVDEAQFASKAQVEFLTHIVDDLEVPVICYGLRADFKNNFFEGSQWLMAWADKIEEIKTICWCGSKAVCNTRVVNGEVVREGEQLMLGGNSTYTSLCRKHWKEGNLGPDAERFKTAHKKSD